MRICLAGLLILVSVWVSACAGGHKDNSAPAIENIYVEHMKDFTRVGVDAMHQERWASAQHAFGRALQMAKLANEPGKVASTWYNLAMAYKGGGEQDKAEVALQKVLSLAIMHRFPVYKSRAELQLDLLYIKQGKRIEKSFELANNLPADVYAIAGHLAYAQHQSEQAALMYQKAIQSAKKNRSGLLLKASSMMGLSLLAKEKGDAGMAKEQALHVLRLSQKVGAPRLSANASLLLAGLSEGLSLQARLDYAERAQDIYIILQDKRSATKARELVQRLAGQ